VLQFTALAKAAHEHFPVDCDNGLQHADGRLGQQTEGLLSGRKQPLEFGDGGLSGVALEPEGLVASHRFDACFGRNVFDRCWQGLGREGISLCLDLGDRTLLVVAGLPGYIDCALEVPIALLRFEKTLPEEAVALSRVLAGVPAPEFLDGSLRIFGYPVDQGLGRTEGLGELLPD